MGRMGVSLCLPETRLVELDGHLINLKYTDHAVLLSDDTVKFV